MSLILQCVKPQSTELALLRTLNDLNADEIRGNLWNTALRLLYTEERGNDAVLCIERLFDCEHLLPGRRPSRTWSRSWSTTFAWRPKYVFPSIYHLQC